MTIPSRTAFLLLAAVCAAAPLSAQAPATPRCIPARGPDSTLVRYDCAGRGDWGRVGFSASLPAAWSVEETGDRRMTLTARRGAASITVQASDELFVPVTAADSAEFWAVAAELLLDRPPTVREVDALIRDAGDESGARFMLTRAQSTDSALIALSSMLASTREDVEVVTLIRGPATLAGQRAGRLVQRTREEGAPAIRREGYVTVHNGVFYGILLISPDTEWEGHRALWARVTAAFAIQPPQP